MKWSTIKCAADIKLDGITVETDYTDTTLKTVTLRDAAGRKVQFERGTYDGLKVYRWRAEMTPRCRDWVRYDGEVGQIRAALYVHGELDKFLVYVPFDSKVYRWPPEGLQITSSPFIGSEGDRPADTEGAA